MHNRKLIFVSVLSLLVLFSIVVYALSESDITFPVSELGNCDSPDDCKLYCDNSENIADCLDFAEKYNLMPQDEIEEARKIAPLLLKGEMPGGCTDKEECDAYCEKDENFEECIDFAVKAGYVSEKEAEMAKKTGGKGPGDCVRDECDDFCEKDENFEVCLEWAHEHDMISEEDYEMAKKTGGKGPGDCKGAEECDAYCDDHIKECMDWMIEHDLLSDEDKERLDNMDDDMRCMLDCMLDKNLRPGEDCGPGNMENPGCQECAGECFSVSRRERGLEEGVPVICLDRDYNQEQCQNYCNENPTDCGRPADQQQENGDINREMDESHVCMAECMIEAGLTPGVDCPGGEGGPECTACVNECIETRQPSSDDENHDLTEAQICMSSCMIDAGLTPGKDCPGGTGSSECDACSDKCIEFNQPEQGGDASGLSDEKICLSKCMIDKGLTPGEQCPTPDCGGCIDKCVEKPQEPAPSDSGDSGSTDSGADSSDGGDAGITGEAIRNNENSGLVTRLANFIRNLF